MDRFLDQLIATCQKALLLRDRVSQQRTHLVEIRRIVEETDQILQDMEAFLESFASNEVQSQIAELADAETINALTSSAENTGQPSSPAGRGTPIIGVTERDDRRRRDRGFSFAVFEEHWLAFSPPQQAAVLLVHGKGLSHQEAAKQLGIDESNVFQRLRRAENKLRYFYKLAPIKPKPRARKGGRDADRHDPDGN